VCSAVEVEEAEMSANIAELVVVTLVLRTRA